MLTMQIDKGEYLVIARLIADDETILMTATFSPDHPDSAARLEALLTAIDGPESDGLIACQRTDAYEKWASRVENGA